MNPKKWKNHAETGLKACAFTKILMKCQGGKYEDDCLMVFQLVYGAVYQNIVSHLGENISQVILWAG